MRSAARGIAPDGVERRASSDSRRWAGGAPLPREAGGGVSGLPGVPTGQDGGRSGRTSSARQSTVSSRQQLSPAAMVGAASTSAPCSAARDLALHLSFRTQLQEPARLSVGGFPRPRRHHQRGDHGGGQDEPHGDALTPQANEAHVPDGQLRNIGEPHVRLTHHRYPPAPGALERCAGVAEDMPRGSVIPRVVP